MTIPIKPLVIALLTTTTYAHAEPTILKQPPESNITSRTSLNLARAYLGAKIEKAGSAATNAIEPGVLSNDPNEAIGGLISDDETIGFPIKPGSTRIIVTLPRPDLLSKLEFTGFSTAGEMNAWVSPVKLPPDAPGWRSVVRRKKFGQNQPCLAKFGSADAAYVLMEFLTQRPGRIGALGIYGATKISDITVKANQRPIGDQPRMGEAVVFNYANLSSGGKIAYTSSIRGRSDAPTMIDDDLDTRYEFAPVDPSPITIVQLESKRPVRRISVAYEAEKLGRMEFYLLTDIPGRPTQKQAAAREKSEWLRASFRPVPRVIAAQVSDPQFIEIYPLFFQSNKPAGDVETETGTRRIAYECSPKEAQFLMLRWQANDGSSAGKFAISEINIFGNTLEEDVEVTWNEPESPGEGAPEDPNLGFNAPTLNSIEPPDLPTISQP